MEFEKGIYDSLKIKTIIPLPDYGKAGRTPPTTETETTVVKAISAMLDLPEDLISVDRTVFELGVMSLTLSRFEKIMRSRFKIIEKGSIITFLSNPLFTASQTR